MPVEKFEAKTFPHLKKLVNITGGEMEEHLKLYNGYVTNINTLRETIADLVTSNEAETPVYAELVRRLGFEYNGMRLHELYFENLSGEGKNPNENDKEVIGKAFDEWKNWETHFKKMAMMRGVGWVILYKDPESGNLSNHWITLHEDGHPAGFKPILVMDCWEHAWAGYLKPTQRATYVDDFFQNIDWSAIGKRLAE